MDATPLGERDLDERVARGMRWSVVNTVLLRLGSLAAGVVVLRLLSPAEFGVYGAALVVVTTLLSMNELGVSLAIVRRDGDVRGIAPTVATLALVTSAALYLAAFLAAPWLAEVLGAPGAEAMVRVLALCVLVDAVAAVPVQALARDFAQGRRLVIDVVAFVVTTALTVTLAVGGAGAWALVWGFVAGNVVAGSLAVALAPWRVRPGFDMRTARELLGFGLPLAGSSLLLFALMNIDYVVVGNTLGATALGLYLAAFALCSWPVNLVSATIRRVSLAAFSRTEVEQGGRPRAFVETLRGALVLTVPMCTGLAVFAEDLLTTLYGTAWAPAAAALRPLALLAATRVVVELAYDYLVSVDHNRSNLLVQGVWLALLAPALVVGARLDGIRGVGRAHALVAVLVLLVTVVVVSRAGVHTGHLLRAVARPVLGAVPMAAVGLLVLALVPGMLPALLVGGVLSAAAYAVVNRGLLGQLRRHALAPAAGSG